VVLADKLILDTILGLIKTTITNMTEAKTKINNSNNNLWKISAIIFAVLFVATLIFLFRGNLTGNVISRDAAGEKLVDYFNSRTDSKLTYVSAKDLGNIYEITVTLDNETTPFHITKDGKYWVQNLVELPTVRTGTSTGATC
jgi:histone deacetylase complex regulatory component SIN3